MSTPCLHISTSITKQHFTLLSTLDNLKLICSLLSGKNIIKNTLTTCIFMQHKRKVGQLMKQKWGPVALLTREHLTNNLENELFSVNKNKPKRVEEKNYKYLLLMAPNTFAPVNTSLWNWPWHDVRRSRRGRREKEEVFRGEGGREASRVVRGLFPEGRCC